LCGFACTHTTDPAHGLYSICDEDDYWDDDDDYDDDYDEHYYDHYLERIEEDEN
jgi:hypothetical protein